MRLPRPVSSLLLVALALSAGGSVRAEPPAPRDVVALIDKLVEMSDDDMGYSDTHSRNSFLPLDRQYQVPVLVPGEKPPAPSDTLRQLVKRGAAAVPELLAHLGDRRPTRIKADASTSLFSLEDPNGNPAKGPLPPAGPRQDTYTVTVGDLCLVALGQIVNRPSDPVLSLPSGIAVVTSPTRSAVLRESIQDTWDGLTPARHRASLVDDFNGPDAARRLGACKRLAYYYPDALEPPALRLLGRPTYSVAAVDPFVNDRLYRERNPEGCRALFDRFVSEQGDAYRDGILQRLFDDLAELENHERGMFAPKTPFPEFGDRPRKLLVQLYGKPKNVQSKDRPRVASLSDVELAELIREGLIYDRSEKIDRAVRGLLVAADPEDGVGWACVERLVGRGYDAEIEAFGKRALRRATDQTEKWRVENILGRLGWTPLHVAADRNDADTLRELLRGKARADAPDRDGCTPLHVAAASGNLECVRLLVEAGVPLDTRDKWGRTPAQDAAWSDYLEVAQYLVGRGCSLPDVYVAAIAGRADLVERFVRADASVLDKRTPRLGRNPLDLAAWCGHAKVAEVLLAHGADGNAGDDRRWTPLHVAAALGKDAVVRVLLRSGVNPRGRPRDCSMEPLHLAAQYGHVRVVEALLDAKAPPEVKAETDHDATPLHLAARAGQTAVVALLLKRGAKVDPVDDLGRTPLHLAAMSGQARVAELLLKGGAKVGVADGHLYTALHHACKGGDLGTVRVLLDHGADVNAEAQIGFFAEMPLDFARRSGQPEVIKLLEQRGAKPGGSKLPAPKQSPP
jgi:ankyrin repeat protein